MQKWIRNYIAEFEIGVPKSNRLSDAVPDHKLTIRYPFSCQFKISSGISNGQNNASFQFINLSENDRADLFLDVWNFSDKYVYMKFYAGYGDTLPLVFEGRVQRCTSGKQGGDTEFITTIEAYDQGHFFDFGYLNATFTKGTTLSDILKIACEGSRLRPGYITPDIAPLMRDRTFIGQTGDLLRKEYSGYEFFINNNEINILDSRDLIPGEVQVISDSAGLLGSPQRGTAYVDCEIIFEPQLRAGQGIVLQSYSLPWLNQAYKIVRVEHTGTISPNVCGQLVTNLTLSALDKPTRELKKTPETSYTGKSTTGVWKKPIQGQITSPFMPNRKNPVTGKIQNHNGIDIGAQMNTPIYAPANGKVTAAYISGSLTTDFGRFVAIDHGKINGIQVSSWYGHLNSWVVRKDQQVEQGQLIGYVGSSGRSDGPHLHFQINENGIPVNPTKYIGNYG